MQQRPDDREADPPSDEGGGDTVARRADERIDGAMRHGGEEAEHDGQHEHRLPGADDDDARRAHLAGSGTGDEVRPEHERRGEQQRPREDGARVEIERRAQRQRGDARAPGGVRRGLEARPAQPGPRQRGVEGVQRPDDRGPEPAAEVERQMRPEQAAVSPRDVVRHDRAQRGAAREEEGRRQVPARRPGRTLERAPAHAPQRVRVDRETGEDERPADAREGGDPQRDAHGDGDDRAVPQHQLQAHRRSRGRVGRKERAGEELRGADDELRHTAHEGAVQRQPAQVGRPREGGEHPRDGGDDEPRDADREEGRQRVAGPGRPRRERGCAPASRARAGARVARAHASSAGACVAVISTMQPATSGGRGVNPVSSASEPIARRTPRTTPRCSVQTTAGFSRTASAYGHLRSS